MVVSVVVSAIVLAVSVSAPLSAERQSVSQAAQRVTVPAAFQGLYTQHAGGFTIREHGPVVVSYQAYLKRDKGLPSFPRLKLRIASIDGRTLSGRVVRSSDPRVSEGTTFRLVHRYPGMRLTIPGLPWTMEFCTPRNRSKGRCGA